MGTMAHLASLIENSQVDWLLHVGDVAYADGNQMIWDEYGRQFEGVGSSVPYVLLPGNHEIMFNFSAYRHRYPMEMSATPGDVMYWAFDRASSRVRFIGIEAESQVNTALLHERELEWIAQVLFLKKIFFFF